MLNRTGKIRHYRAAGHAGPELENHFVLRLPEAQAEILKEDIRQGQTNIKDRLSIQLDHAQDKEDMRNGIITLDTIMYKARLVDLPTIVETWKTIDGKNFYKTADVCQMFMVREGEDPPEEEDPKKKKRDPNKVDKKYLWPHGYTHPLKNVRKRRFRKTLRKKNLDLPDIEKEVKRLLRADNEAMEVEFEVIKEEDEKKLDIGADLSASNLDNKELFGELSSSEDEVGPTINIIEDDEDSRLTVEDSQGFMNETANSPFSKPMPSGSSPTGLVTEFSSSMFNTEADFQIKTEPMSPKGDFQENREKLYARLSHLESDMNRLVSQRAADAAKAATIDNLTLKQKFLAKLANVENLIKDKEMDIMDVQRQLLE